MVGIKLYLMDSNWLLQVHGSDAKRVTCRFTNERVAVRQCLYWYCVFDLLAPTLLQLFRFRFGIDFRQFLFGLRTFVVC